MQKVLVISHYADQLISFRGELIKGMVDKGYKVKAIAPETGYESDLSKLGAEYESISLDRTGMNPIKDLKTIYQLYKKIKEYKPDVVFSYTIKPNIYGGIAARLNGVDNINALVPGAGVIFREDNRQGFLFNIVRALYRSGIKENNTIFFQNPDDQQLFHDLKLVSDDTKSVVVNGSGVKTDYYEYKEPNLSPITFLIMARLIGDKGIYEYVEAAEVLKEKYSDVEFNILGPLDSNPTATQKEEVEEWDDKGHINYLGVADDVRPYLQESSVFVLPSYYREGTPRSILEAMSTGRAIITTDSVGCRETVEQGRNGILVPTKDSASLADAMERLINDKDKIIEMGKESRKMAEEKYDVHKVNQVMYDKMGI